MFFDPIDSIFYRFLFIAVEKLTLIADFSVGAINSPSENNSYASTFFDTASKNAESRNTTRSKVNDMCRRREFCCLLPVDSIVGNHADQCWHHIFLFFLSDVNTSSCIVDWDT